MNNYALAVDLTKVYEEQFTQLYSCLQQVAQEQEYVEFIRVNKKYEIYTAEELRALKFNLWGYLIMNL
jgi:hypothetical protein